MARPHGKLVSDSTHGPLFGPLASCARRAGQFWCVLVCGVWRCISGSEGGGDVLRHGSAGESAGCGTGRLLGRSYSVNGGSRLRFWRRRTVRAGRGNKDEERTSVVARLKRRFASTRRCAMAALLLCCVALLSRSSQVYVGLRPGVGRGGRRDFGRRAGTVGWGGRGMHDDGVTVELEMRGMGGWRDSAQAAKQPSAGRSGRARHRPPLPYGAF